MRPFAFFGLALVTACAPTAQEPVATQDDAFIDLLAQTNAKVEQFQLSPDGTQIAYASAQNGSLDIWVMNADGSNARALTDFYPDAEGEPRWSPDGRWILYSARVCGTACWTEIFLVRPDGSAPPVNISYGRAGGGPVWMPDGESIVYARGGASGQTQIAIAPGQIPGGAIDARFLSHPSYSSSGPQVSPDGQWIAFTSDRSGKNDRKRMDIWLVPSRGGPERLLTPNTPESYEYFPTWSPDGRQIAFVSNRSRWRNVGVIDVASGDVRMLTESAWDEYNPQWSPDGQWIAYVANQDWDFHLMKVAAHGGTPQQLTERTGVSGGFGALQVRGTFQWSRDGQSIAYTYMGPTTTNDIWIIGADGGAPTRLTNHMPAGLSEDRFVTPERISYTSADGLDVPAFLYRPPTTAGPAPLLVYARANTHGLHVNGFYPFIQYFVSRGFVVLAPQVRGSAGKGRDYEWLNFGDWGGGDIDDFVAGVNHLAQQGIIDPNRVVMQGGSTGGYFTMQTIVRYPDLLKAAVNFYGPTNLVHMYDYYSPSQRPTLGDVVGGDHGDPTQAPAHWRERSAIFNIDQIKTPLLILWGDRDYGVRMSMADEYYALAQQKGKPTDYVLYHNESHGWYNWRPESLRDAIARVAAHYAKYVSP
ncbi:MAG: S9 family peptidase [Gemmatimonadetes bacterium]|nr:S9 family peptidase [Gemmatimonadota bacterium]